MESCSGKYLGTWHVSCLYIEHEAGTGIVLIPCNAEVAALQAVGGPVWISRHGAIL
ncbi:hypothetical protein MASR2M48_16680 [Spirochaetota bacterium]